jgi:DNA-binding MarR family transcriptional regulator
MYIEQDVKHTSKYQLLLENHFDQSEILNMKWKSKNISFNRRQLVIFSREKGKSFRKIGTLLNLSKATVTEIIKSDIIQS